MKLLNDDCLNALKSFPDNSIDSVVTDPPYHLTSIVKRFGATNAAPAKFGKDGAFARASAGFMGQTWDGGDIAFRVELWAEIFRVLKPGGHVLAFSGTRTYHRMACAIEDAGFEIRDQIGWAYGSGFPKSHDVSKGIDKAAGVERETVGRRRNNKGNSGIQTYAAFGAFEQSRFSDVTIPATDAAKQWEGWGTALKPAWEPICVARKPLISKKIDVLNTIEAQLKEIGFQEIKWKKRPVKPVKKQNHTKNFTSTRPLLTAETYVENVRDSETQEIGNNSESVIENVDEGGLATTIQENLNYQESTIENFVSKFLKLMETNVNVAEKLKSPFYVSTILMEEALNTENPLDIEKFILNLENQDFQKGIGYCVGIVTGLSGSMATVHIKHEDGVFEWPYELPKVIPEKYLTVAENVLTHGTGAINIDGCRVEAQARPLRELDVKATNSNVYSGRTGDGGLGKGLDGGSKAVGTTDVGRWPANIIHDGSDEVLAAFPESKGAQGAVKGTEKPKVGTNTFGDYGQRPPQDIRGDNGSAARFFYCAKTSKKERGEGNNHPTVKPIALMAYLCRLVTPPNGIVLDPFMGSGSTGIAAQNEGFDFIGIEREESYFKIASNRIEDHKKPSLKNLFEEE